MTTPFIYNLTTTYMNGAVLSRAQIEALPTEQVNNVYELAKAYYEGLLARVQKDHSLRSVLQPEIKAARLQYVMLRLRQYPKHFAKLNVAS